MDAGQAWHFLITHCRNLEVQCGSARVQITITDEGWRTVMRRGEVIEKADGTHTHDLLTYLAYTSRGTSASAQIAQGQPFTRSEGVWLSRSDWNANFSTLDGRRMHIYNGDGVESMLSFIEFQSSHP